MIARILIYTGCLAGLLLLAWVGYSLLADIRPEQREVKMAIPLDVD